MLSRFSLVESNPWGFKPASTERRFGNLLGLTFESIDYRTPFFFLILFTKFKL